MEDARMEDALHKLGTCQVRTPARLARNMTLTVRALEKEEARRMAEKKIKQIEKGQVKTRSTAKALHPDAPDKKKTL